MDIFNNDTNQKKELKSFATPIETTLYKFINKTFCLPEYSGFVVHRVLCDDIFDRLVIFMVLA